MRISKSSEIPKSPLVRVHPRNIKLDFNPLQDVLSARAFIVTKMTPMSSQWITQGAQTMTA
jgi:hypothetical protein